MESDRPHHEVPSFSLSLPAGLVVLWRIRKLGVRTTGASDACADLAASLAAEGREDPEAVRSLIALARGRRRRLTMAAQRVNIEGRAYERDNYNRAHRLLRAAVSRSAVEPASPAVRARIDAIEHLVALPLPDAFASLCEREPRLRAVEAHVRSEVEQAQRAAIRLADSSSRQRVELHSQIWHMLKPCIGPGSGTTDQILTAEAVHQVARRYLHSLIT